MAEELTTEKLRDELTRALGFSLSSLRRLDGASSLNFKAVRASDGLTFAVKCAPPARSGMFKRLEAHLREMTGARVPERLFEDTCPKTICGYHLICLSWCAGERRMPDELSESEWDAFLDAYSAFSAAMQRCTLIVPEEPLLTWLEGARAQSQSSRALRELIERELPASELTYNPARRRVIHGDFHHGNFLFEKGVVQGFFDLEEFLWGYPADDLVRYFVCAAEHLPIFATRRRARLLSRFRYVVRKLGWPKDEWILAIDALLVRKLYMKTSSGCSFFRARNLLWRARLYLQMKRIVKEA